jgi:hypothetical protein
VDESRELALEARRLNFQMTSSENEDEDVVQDGEDSSWVSHPSNLDEGVRAAMAAP